ncbi:MAG: methyltransferase [Xanthobacteraceae bacterium]|nr:methyltransferase [Xanthobacteraceae bacterium]
MTHDIHIPSQGVPPHVQLIQMVTGAWVSGTLVAAAKLNLADQLAGGAKSAAELAALMGVHELSLHRLMRTLASLGLLASQPDGRYALTALGEALRTGAPGSAKATVLSFGSNWFQRTWSELSYSVETGQNGFEKAHGMRLFEYLAQHPEDAALFSETMVGVHGQEPPAVAATYDFSPFDLIVDVGGATGNLLSAILAHHPRPRGVLFDLPHVVGEAPVLLKQRGIGDRVTIEAGDFFKTVPEGADTYLLSHILHDWSEDRCRAILENVRKAMKPTSRLLIIEMVLPEDDAPHPGKMIDLLMLVATGGQERTQSEYRQLLDSAGFHLTRVVPTRSAASVVEAVLA